jgi:hypothetical protein
VRRLSVDARAATGTGTEQGANEMHTPFLLAGLAMSCALAQTTPTTGAIGTTYFGGTGCDFNSADTSIPCGAGLIFKQNASANPTTNLDR